MTASDLENRYGPMVSVEALAQFFHARTRQMQALLRREGVPIYDVGDTPVVPLRIVEQRLHLDPEVEAGGPVDQMARQQAKWKATHQPDGSSKNPREYLLELRAKSPELIARLEQSLEEQGRRELVAQ